MKWDFPLPVTFTSSPILFTVESRHYRSQKGVIPGLRASFFAGLDLYGSMVARTQHEISSKHCTQPLSSCLVSLRLPLPCMWDLGGDKKNSVALSQVFVVRTLSRECTWREEVIRWPEEEKKKSFLYPFQGDKISKNHKIVSLFPTL